MSARLDISADELLSVQEALTRLKRMNWAMVHKDLGEEMRSRTLERFARERDPDGKPWQPLADATKALKRRAHRKYRRGRMAILQSQGFLRGSIHVVADAESARVGPSPVAYAAIHQFGGQAGRRRKVTIPARPYLGITDGDADALRGIVLAHITRALS